MIFIPLVLIVIQVLLYLYFENSNRHYQMELERLFRKHR